MRPVASLPAYRFKRGEGIAGLVQGAGSPGELGIHDVRVRIHAVALNHRDLLVADGQMGDGELRVPCSDGAGEIVAIGDGVTEFSVGDRVMPTFFPDWIDGEPLAPRVARALGGNIDGVLQAELIVPVHALVATPAHLSHEEAATLPCAGLTAWHALFEASALRAGQRVLVLGTGGVAIWALQLAKAAGAHVTVVSSDDSKLARARALSADATVNYREFPQWNVEVRRLNEGLGVDVTVETGGKATVALSIAATRMGGTIALVGGVAGGFDVSIDGFALAGGKRLVGVLVGSRVMAERLARFVALANLRPAVDRVFAFENAGEAFAYLAAARHVGKVVIGGYACAFSPGLLKNTPAKRSPLLPSRIIAMAGVVLGLAACTAAQVRTPEGFSGHAASYDVSGHSPRRFNEPVRFGPYSALEMREGTTFAWALPAGHADVGRTAKPHAFTLVALNQPPVQVQCRVRTWKASINGPTQSLEVDLTGLAGPMMACSLKLDGTRAEPLELSRNGTRVKGTLVAPWGGEYSVRSIAHFEGAAIASSTPTGYEISGSRGVVAVVDILNAGRVHLDNQLDEEQRVYFAAASAALLLLDPEFDQFPRFGNETR